MKTYRILLFTIIISCFSCKKEEPKTHTVEGKWLLIDGEVYMENMDKGGVIYYDHFSAAKPNSAMDLSGANLPIDFISQNKTTWEFGKEFKLNDSMTYEVAYERYSVRIYGLENGSARILMIDSITDDFIRFTAGERRQSINGVNRAYFSKLSFIKIR